MEASDTDFYLRKIHRLEEELAVVQTDSAQLRHRLRAAEDYEIRYHILVKTSETQIMRLKNLQDRAEETRRQEAVNAQLVHHQAIWQKQTEEMEATIKEQARKEKADLEATVERLRAQFDELNGKRQEMQLFGFKTKKMEQEIEDLKTQLADTRQQYDKQREQEAANLRNSLNSAFRDKLTHERNNYQSKISSLERQLIQLEIQNDSYSLRPLPDNHALTNLQQIHQQQAMQNHQETLRHQQLLREKTDEIRKITKQREEEDEDRRKQQQDLKKIIKYLQNQLQEKEKQHQQEIYDLVKHINQTKEEERSQLKQQLQAVKQQLADCDAHWHSKLLQQVQIAEQMGRLDQQERNQLHQEKRNLQSKVKQLLARLDQHGIEREADETELLIRSLREIENRQEQTGSYDNGITFLDRQLKKCQLKLQEKTTALNHLSLQTAQTQAQNHQTITELRQRLFTQKQNNQAELTSLQQQLQDLNDSLRAKERQATLKDQHNAVQLQEFKQKYKINKEMAEELQRDYSRVLDTKKKLERECRELREKGSTGEMGPGRRQKWLQLEKHKNQLQIIYRERQQRLQNDLGSQLTSATTQLQNTTQSQAQLQQLNHLLTKEVQRLKQQLESNKENHQEQKIATLQLEVALTQNIYESLLQVKGQSLGVDSPARKLAEIDLKEDKEEDSREPMLLSCHQTSPRT